MPRRQSTLRSSKSTAKKPRKSKGRTQDALAIAELENPTRVRIQRHRLGEVEDDGERRQNRGGDFESGDDAEGDSRPSKRRKTSKPTSGDAESSEEGSDSDGNHWRMGAVDSDDDSELDSDEAMGESDEERYKDYAFLGSAKRRPKENASKSKHGPIDGGSGIGEIDLSEGDESFGGFSGDEDDDDLGDDAVDLATALDMNEEEEAEYAREQTAAKDRGQLTQVEDDNDVDDDATEDDGDSESSGLSFSEDEDEDTHSKRLSKLQDFISSVQAESGRTSGPRQRHSNAQEQSTPSEFGVAPTQKLTVADLIPTVTDPRLKNSLKLLSSAEKPPSTTSRVGIPGKLAAPLPRRLQDRLDRTAAYEKSKEILDRWVDTVKRNRRAEHLSFPLVNQGALAPQGTRRFLPTSGSKPLNDLEGTIQAILQESGLQSQNGADGESRIQAFEELQSNKLPIEEVETRRAELRRARDLLFREEVRAKRIKKIKSKSYRRVHRKERQRVEKQKREALAAAGVELSEDEHELNDRRRAKGRMGARLRASRWAKGVKETGKATWDEDAREGVAEMARKGEELRRRIEGKHIANPDDDYLEPSSSDSDDEISDLESQGAASRRRHERQFHRVGPKDIPETQTGIMSMKFMKNAEAARKATNDADVERLRRERNGEDSPSAEEPEETGRRKFGRTQVLPGPQRPHEASNLEASEFEEKLAASDGEVDAVDEDDLQDIRVDSSTSGPKRPQTVSKSETKSSLKISRNEQSMDIHANPWLSGPSQSSKKQKHAPPSNDAPLIIANPDPQPKSSKSSSRPKTPAKQPTLYSRSASPTSSTSSSSSPSTPGTPSTVHRNASLVKAAFAGDDVFASFSAEKASLAASEDEKEISNALPGWGTWTGAGISKKRLKRQQSHPQNKKHVVKVSGVRPSDRKDANLSNVTISEKRVRKNGKYLASQLPHPFESRAQYERSLRLPVGPEWTTKKTFQSGTKPRVMVKKGAVVRPM